VSIQSTIAADIIAQLGEASFAAAVPYTAAYRRMYIDALEDMPPAGSPESVLKITIAPVEYNSERTGWGAAHVEPQMGIICEKMVSESGVPPEDSAIDPLETFVENLCTWFSGPRQFASVWNSKEPKAIFGDDYIGELYESGRFFVPILVTFFADGGAS